MIIEPKDANRRIARTSGRRRIVTAALALAVVLLGLGFSVGLIFRDYLRPSLQALTGRTALADSVGALSLAPTRFMHAWMRPAEVQTIQIDLKFKHFDRIQGKRREALSKGLLVTEDDDMVPGKLQHGDRTYDVELRLKGDLTDHLAGDKWSLRIHVKGGDALFGMRRFSIQSPETRGFQAEALFLHSLRDQGVLAPRYDFVDVVLNGRRMGLMAIEEHFSKELLESQRQRESVILKFDEGPFWANLLANGGHGPYENFQTARISAFGEGSIGKVPALRIQLSAAVGLLRGFAEGDLTASEVFDEELLGRFLAMCEIWGSVHAVRWHNLRFYFNPVDRQLSPIGFDGNLQAHHLGRGLLVLEEPITRAFIQDERVRSAYVQSLRRLAEGLVDGTLIERWSEREEALLRLLHREYPTRAPIDWTPLVVRAKSLLRVSAEGLESFETPYAGPEAEWPLVVDAAIIRDLGGFLEFRNVLPYPVTIDSVQFEAGQLEDGSVRRLELPQVPIQLPATPRGTRPEIKRVDLVDVLRDLGSAPIVATGMLEIEGDRRKRPFEIRSGIASARSAPFPEPGVDELIRRMPFLERDGNDPDLVSVRPGTWIVREPLLLPAGIGLRMVAGTTLRFAEDASLVVRGPLDFRGTSTEQIVLEPASLAGEDPTWRGVVVLGAQKESFWSHVVVRSTRAFQLGDWSLTGGVSFYQSDLRIENSRFEGHLGEDALNVIRSQAMISDTTFFDTPSDAFDGDFVTGRMVRGLFERVGGDGVDVSGADFLVEGTRFKDIRDKAVSVGEGSRLRADKISVARAGTGVASKDRSLAEVRDSVFREIEHVTLMAYVKKPEFGASELVAERIDSDVPDGRLALAQIGSSVSIDGRSIDESEFDADRVYQEGYMRK